MRLPYLRERRQVTAVAATAPQGDPCPASNGTIIGTVQQFVLLCGADVLGDTINTTATTSLGACTDACATNHPRCEAVSFDGRQCALKANVFTRQALSSRRVDTAMAQFPQATSNCDTLGATSVSGTGNFNVFCGAAITGNDLLQTFSQTFQACMGVCATTAGCSAVSFDASMALGFQNCYLKSATRSAQGGQGGQGGLRSRQGIDSAVFNSTVAVQAQVSQVAVDSTPTAPLDVPSTDAAVPSATEGADPLTTLPADPTITDPAAASLALADTTPTEGAFYTTDSLVTGLGALQTGVPNLGAPPDALSQGGMPAPGVPGIPLGNLGPPPPDFDFEAVNRQVAGGSIGGLLAFFVLGTAFVLWARRRAARAIARGEPSVFARVPLLRPKAKQPTTGTRKLAADMGVRLGGGGGAPRYEVRQGQMTESMGSAPGGMGGVGGRANGSGMGMAMIAAQARQNGQGSALDGIPGFLRE